MLVSCAHFRYSKGSSALCAEWGSDSCPSFNPRNQTTFYIGVKADSSDHDVRDATLKFTRVNIANVTDVDDIQGNLLKGIDNCLGVAQSVVQVHSKALDNNFSSNFSLFQVRSIKRFMKTL